MDLKIFENFVGMPVLNMFAFLTCFLEKLQSLNYGLEIVELPVFFFFFFRIIVECIFYIISTCTSAYQAFLENILVIVLVLV